MPTMPTTKTLGGEELLPDCVEGLHDQLRDIAVLDSLLAFDLLAATRATCIMLPRGRFGRTVRRRSETSAPGPDGCGTPGYPDW